MTFGLTKDGFIPYTLADSKAWWESKFRALFGDSVNLRPESVFGQVISAAAERDELIWSQIERYYTTRNPNNAFGVILDNLCARNGIFRFPATKSKVVVSLVGDVGTVVPSGTIFSVLNNPLSKFASDYSVTLSAGTDEIQSIIFSAVPTSGTWTIDMDGSSVELAWNETSDTLKSKLQSINTIREVTVSGNFAGGFIVQFSGASGKAPRNLMDAQSSLFTTPYAAVGISVVRVSAGTYQGTVECSATNAGSSYTANAWTLRNIESSVTGLSFIDNPLDAVIGDDVESDVELRERRAQTLAKNGSATTEAIMSAIEAVSSDIEYCRVFENETDVVVNGWDPHSVAAYVHQKGSVNDYDDQIAQAIYSKKSAGIKTMGTVERFVADSKGYKRAIRFYRAIEVLIYIEIDLVLNSSFPDGGIETLKANIAKNGNELGVANSVVVHPTVESWIAGIPGILDLAIRIGRTQNPTSDANIVIGDGTNGLVEFSSWDTSRIIINT